MTQLIYIILYTHQKSELYTKPNIYLYKHAQCALYQKKQSFNFIYSIEERNESTLLLHYNRVMQINFVYIFSSDVYLNNVKIKKSYSN